MTRETASIFLTLGARRTGHGAKAKASLATGRSPVDSPSGERSGAEIARAKPSRERPAGRKKHDLTFLYMSFALHETFNTKFPVRERRRILAFGDIAP